MVLPTGGVKCVSVVITSNNFSTLCFLFYLHRWQHAYKQGPGGRSGGEEWEGSAAINPGLAAHSSGLDELRLSPAQENFCISSDSALRYFVGV